MWDMLHAGTGPAVSGHPAVPRLGEGLSPGSAWWGSSTLGKEVFCMVLGP